MFAHDEPRYTFSKMKSAQTYETTVLFSILIEYTESNLTDHNDPCRYVVALDKLLIASQWNCIPVRIVLIKKANHSLSLAIMMISLIVRTLALIWDLVDIIYSHLIGRCTEMV